MLEYRSATLETKKSFITRTPNGDIDCDRLDEMLNQMAQDNWELNKIESLQHPSGTGTLLCIFSREQTSDKVDPPTPIPPTTDF